ncbi:hypothetical protein ACS0TY_006409 [Phlomoides rotata]
MTISLDDVHSISGLSIVGEPVQSVREDKVLGVVDVMNLGRTEKEATIAIGGARGSFVKLAWLRETFRPLMSSDDPDQYMEDMIELSNYAWGAVTLAYLYRQLGLASKYKVKQIGGYLTLVEAWIYEHLPYLILPPQNPDFVYPRPLSMRYAPEAHTGPNPDRVRDFRERLNASLPSEVNWNPYRMDYYPFQEVSFFYGCIVCGNVVEPYMPDRVLRQFSYVQTIPENPLISRVKRRGGNYKRTKYYWGAFADYFQMWDTHLLTDERLGEQCQHPCFADGYMDWFLSNSRPFVSNPQIKTLSPHEYPHHPEPRHKIDAANF